MNLLEQCSIWHENDEYQKIIEAIEQLSVEERTPEYISELARAYNNYANGEDKESYLKAVDLLESIEEDYKEDHNWNFRIAFAYYYLDQEEKALYYFKRALDARPGDEDTLEFIEDCRRILSNPKFEKTFAQRVHECWDAFTKKEADLRTVLDSMNQSKNGENIIEQCHAILAIAFENISFELGFNGQKYELVLTPEGDISQLYKLVYFKQQAPKEVFKHWNIVIGRECFPSFALRVNEQEISGSDVLVWMKKLEDGKHISIELYCGKLLPLLHEDKNQTWWMLATLLDQMLGEISAMDIIRGFHVLDTKKEEPSISLLELKEVLEKEDIVCTKNAEQFLEHNYSMYQMEPTQNEDADLRYDVYTGSNRHIQLVQEYYEGANGTMDAFHQDGAVCGFFYYPLNCFEDDDAFGKTILDFRDELEANILAEVGEQAITFIGGASGHTYGYLDCIAWDLQTVLNSAERILEDTPLSWASFHTFRKETSGINLMNKNRVEIDEDDETSDSGHFVGSALLSKAVWDKAQFIQDMKDEWDITIEEEGDQVDNLILFDDGDMKATIFLLDAPIPNQEAEENAKNNYMWPKAVDFAKEHQAHIVVAILGENVSLIERGKLFVKAMAVCCKQQYVTGIYTSGTVFEPSFYLAFSQMMKEDELPIYNWIWFGLYGSEHAVNTYTYGMSMFGKAEMEVLEVDAQPADVREFLSDLVTYVLESDVELLDGETIGFSADDKHSITYSEGVSLPCMTLKIGYTGLH